MGVIEAQRRPTAGAVVAGAALIVTGLLVAISAYSRAEPTSLTEPKTTSTAAPTSTPIATETSTPTDASAPETIASAMGNFRLYAVSATGRLAGYLDARTGEFFARNLSDPANVHAIRRLDDGRLVLFGRDAFVVDADLTGSAKPVPHGLANVSSVQPGAGEAIWAVHQPIVVGAPAFELVEIDVRGRELARTPSPAGTDSPAWLHGDEVLVAGGGRIFLRNITTGATRVYAVGALNLVERGHVVWQACPTVATCTNYVGDARNPTLYSFAERYYLNHNSFSPDGNYFVLGVETDSYLVDLRTGTRRSLGPGVVDAQAWSPDSRWLVLKSSPYDVRAVELQGDREVQFRLPSAARGIIAV